MTDEESSIGCAAIALVAGAVTLAPAQSTAAPKFACNTAKLIVPWKAGGGTHIIFSIFEKTMQNLDVSPKIKVVTVPGQGGNKGAKEAAKAKPDGCTLFAIHQSAITSYLNGRITRMTDEAKMHLFSSPVHFLEEGPEVCKGDRSSMFLGPGS